MSICSAHRFCGLGAAIVPSLFLTWVGPVTAQVAEVPSPNSRGDFTTAYVQGNRGYYTNTKWLVLATYTSQRAADYTLNCRHTPNGEVRSRLLPGAIVTAVFQGTNTQPGWLAPDPATDAIVVVNGVSWLRIRGIEEELAYPAQPGRFETLGECYVRANSQYIAPINNEALMR